MSKGKKATAPAVSTGFSNLSQVSKTGEGSVWYETIEDHTVLCDVLVSEKSGNKYLNYSQGEDTYNVFMGNQFDDIQDGCAAGDQIKCQVAHVKPLKKDGEYQSFVNDNNVLIKQKQDEHLRLIQMLD